jgi:hypothetical protein
MLKKGLLLNDNHSETAGIKLDVKGENQHLKLNFAHREVRDSVTATHNLGELNYNVKTMELVDFRTFYRIRNLDFYPRIRELVYVGYGDGQYNEDGEEEEEDGDYDWEIVAIDYANSQESTELTANFTANISAGSRYPELLQRMHLNLEGVVSEQSICLTDFFATFLYFLLLVSLYNLAKSLAPIKFALCTRDFSPGI